MKYFTPELYVRLQDRAPAAMDAADAAWESASQRYDNYLQTILPDLPLSIRHLIEDYYLHDAEVLSVGRQGDAFLILLQLDTPPNDLLSITYTLTADPVIDRSALPLEYRSPRMAWQYEELERCGAGADEHHLHSILFSNGWEIRVPFREAHLAVVQPIYPCPHQAIPLTSSGVSPIP